MLKTTELYILNKFVRFFLYLYYTQTSNEINNTYYNDQDTIVLKD